MTRRILVTGANKGIGKATVAAILNAQEDTHVLLGSRSKERGDAAREDLLAGHSEWADRIEVLEIDVSSDDSVIAAVEKVAAAHGRSPAPLFAIVNNAGVGLGDAHMGTVLTVNAWGPFRVCEAFLPLLDPEAGRIVNVSSASGPNFVNACAPERQQMLTNPDVTWEEVVALMEECLSINEKGGDFEAAGLGEGSAYGLSKACLNAYTMDLARNHPNLVINACTPGFIETDLTRPFAEDKGVSPEEMGMKKPDQGTKATLHLLFDHVGGSGWYFGSDAERSPIDRYRSPGDPPYTGD
jgi:NAD(P)-dependent dehydrogenase (short-subunit alcohol dehydrogenase family)